MNELGLLHADRKLCRNAAGVTENILFPVKIHRRSLSPGKDAAGMQPGLGLFLPVFETRDMGQTDRQTRPTPMRYVFVYGGGSSNRRLYRLVAPSMKTFLVGFIPSISVSIWVMTRSAAADPARVTTLTQHVAGETHPVIFL